MYPAKWQWIPAQTHTHDSPTRVPFCIIFSSLSLLDLAASPRDMSRVHRAGCPLRRRRRRKDTLGALDGLAGVGEGCVVRSVPSRRGLAVARAAPSVPAILWLAAHPRRRLQAARFATRAATRTAKGSRWCAEVGRHTAGRAARRRPGVQELRAQGLSAAARSA